MSRRRHPTAPACYDPPFMRKAWLLPIAVLGLCMQCGPLSPADTGPADGPGLDSAADVVMQDVSPLDLGMPDGAMDVRVDRADVGTDVVVDAGPRTVRAVNDCDPAMAMDLRSTPNVIITSGPDYAFHPNCVRVSVGQTVTFRIDSTVTWMTHPLRAGEIVDLNEVADPASPIPTQETGMLDVPVTFTTMGTYGFYCTHHYISGHMGAAHVVP